MQNKWSFGPIDLNLRPKKKARIGRPWRVKAVVNLDQVSICAYYDRRHPGNVEGKYECVLDVDPLSIMLGIVHDILLAGCKLRLKEGNRE